MGGPCNHLVPAAILYLNKGLTLEEYTEKLDNFNKRVNPMSVINRGQMDLFMPTILNLKKNKAFIEYKKSQYDSEYNYNKISLVNNSKGYKVTHKKLTEDYNLSFDIAISSSSTFGGYKKGDFLGDEEIPFLKWDEDLEFQITKILYSKLDLNNPDIINQRLKFRILRFQKKTEEFTNLQNLIESYPQYKIDFIFDFSPNEGILYTGSVLRNKPSFRWEKRNNKYFLKEPIMNYFSPNSIFLQEARKRPFGLYPIHSDSWYHNNNLSSTKGFSYTDFILTLEALRRNELEVVSYDGVRSETFKLITSDEKTLRKYENAVIDTETSMYAIKHQMTNSEFLRYRLQNYHNREHISLEKMKTYSEVETKTILKNRPKPKLRIIYKDEIPF